MPFPFHSGFRVSGFRAVWGQLSRTDVGERPSLVHQLPAQYSIRSINTAPRPSHATVMPAVQGVMLSWKGACPAQKPGFTLIRRRGWVVGGMQMERGGRTWRIAGWTRTELGLRVAEFRSLLGTLLWGLGSVISPFEGYFSQRHYDVAPAYLGDVGRTVKIDPLRACDNLYSLHGAGSVVGAKD